MAHSRSAKKRIRQRVKRTQTNRARKSRLHTFVRGVEDALAAGDKAGADAALREAQPYLMRAATKGVIHRNRAARKVARLSRRVKALGTEAPSQASLKSR